MLSYVMGNLILQEETSFINRLLMERIENEIMAEVI